MKCKCKGCDNEACANQLLCSPCRKVSNKKYYEKKKVVDAVVAYKPTESKKCSICRVLKDIEQFRYNKDRGRRSMCLSCESKKNKEYYKDRNSPMNIRRYWLYKQKLDKQCMYCGYDKPWALDFHHKDPREKDMTISSLGSFRSEQDVLKEISKCDIVCSNCHRAIHTERIPPRPTIEWKQWENKGQVKAEKHPCPICHSEISMKRQFCGDCVKLKKMWKLIPNWTYYEMLDEVHRAGGVEELSKKVGISAYLLQQKLEGLKIGIK